MGFLDDIAKIALPVVAGSFLGPAAGGLFGSADESSGTKRFAFWRHRPANWSETQRRT